jgi:hypothetical protein
MPSAGLNNASFARRFANLGRIRRLAGPAQSDERSVIRTLLLNANERDDPLPSLAANSRRRHQSRHRRRYDDDRDAECEDRQRDWDIDHRPWWQ